METVLSLSCQTYRNKKTNAISNILLCKRNKSKLKNY